jgi:Ras-related protein Rab-18
VLQDDERMVTREGLAFAQECGCLFLESSAKTRENVEKCFEELALKVYFQKY